MFDEADDISRHNKDELMKIDNKPRKKGRAINSDH